MADVTGAEEGSWRVRRWPGAAAFLDRAEGWLLRSEAEHNLILGIAYGLRRSGSPEPRPYLATLERRGRVGGCAFRTPPHKLGLTRLPVEAVPALVEDVASQYESLPAVLGPEPAAGEFARAWRDARRVRIRSPRRQRIYKLDRVRPPDCAAPGVLRQAGPADRMLIAEWIEAFTVEAATFPQDAASAADRLIGAGAAFLWDDDGAATLAAATGETPNGVRIGYVYTPPARRGRGYATSAVAALSRRVLDSGRGFCCLYTDLANATSNRIYQRIGYEPVADVVDYAFAR